MERRDDRLDPASWVVTAGRPDVTGEPLNTPLVPASNFTLGGQRAYARDDGTPTWSALEEIVGGLEGGSAVAFASGMAAVAAVFELLPAGATIALPDDCYQGVVGLAEAGRRTRNFTVERHAVDDTTAWVDALTRVDLAWLESPSNPLLTVADLRTIASAPRKPGTLLSVDNTFATPLNQRPLSLGADFSMHSATKFIGGHSDLLAGVVAVEREELRDGLMRARELSGATPGVLEAWLAVRGARTLALRLERSQATALDLAGRLESHPRIERVRYPGLESHPGHALARDQLDGFGSIVSFEVVGGAEAADLVCTRTRLIRHATSLGAVESTMERRAAISGQKHLPPSLLRLSVGIEDPDDLWSDLLQALE